MLKLRLVGAALLASCAGLAQPVIAQDDVARLRAEIEALRAQLDELEALRERVRELEAELARLRSSEPAAADSSDRAEAASAVAMEDAGAAAAGAAEPPSPPIELGGALRFTAYDDSFGGGVDTKRGEAGLDLFRVNADGTLGGLELSAEYRFYPYMETIHHGWIGFDFERAGRIEGGVTQVPFGLLPYASHNFWFDVPYYVGLSDDYDLGVKYAHDAGRLDAEFAFFKNAELNDATNLGRYSYDVVSTGPDGNEETNQLNARVAYRLGSTPGCTFDTGASAQRGELYNNVTGGTGDHWAAAVHADVRCGRWNLQGQLARYAFDPANPAGVADDTITVGAFEAAHEIASRADALVANFAYNIPVRSETVDLLTCYNDYSRLDKRLGGFRDSELNVTGCLIGIGPTYTYVDVIRGRNMVYLGGGSLAGGGTDDWSTRLNVNFGYYF